MYLSQTKAILQLRSEAGFSIESARALVAALPKKLDGKRQKVKASDLAKIITEANKPTPPTVVIDKSAPGIRPFRKSLRNQIRRSAGLLEI